MGRSLPRGASCRSRRAHVTENFVSLPALVQRQHTRARVTARTECNVRTFGRRASRPECTLFYGTPSRPRVSRGRSQDVIAAAGSDGLHLTTTADVIALAHAPNHLHSYDVCEECKE